MTTQSIGFGRVIKYVAGISLLAVTAAAGYVAFQALKDPETAKIREFMEARARQHEITWSNKVAQVDADRAKLQVTFENMRQSLAAAHSNKLAQVEQFSKSLQHQFYGTLDSLLRTNIPIQLTPLEREFYAREIVGPSNVKLFLTGPFVYQRSESGVDISGQYISEPEGRGTQDYFFLVRRLSGDHSLLSVHKYKVNSSNPSLSQLKDATTPQYGVTFFNQDARCILFEKNTIQVYRGGSLILHDVIPPRGANIQAYNAMNSFRQEAGHFISDFSTLTSRGFDDKTVSKATNVVAKPK